jgi:hypothetical protein
VTTEDLNAWINCDRCGQATQAKWLIKLVDGELAFCGHHYNEYKDKLTAISFEIIELGKTEEVLADML